MAGVQWFTNLDLAKRHEDLILYKPYNSADYPAYDNYDAIEVSKTVDIPMDYDADQFTLDVAIIGGGISGLATAYHLLAERPALRVTVLEGADRAGGKIVSEQVDGFVGLQFGGELADVDLPHQGRPPQGWCRASFRSRRTSSSAHAGLKYSRL